MKELSHLMSGSTSCPFIKDARKRTLPLQIANENSFALIAKGSFQEKHASHLPLQQISKVMWALRKHDKF